MKKFLAIATVLALTLAFAPSADAQVARPRGGSFGQAVARGVGFGLGQRLGLGVGGFGLNRFGLGFNQFGYGGLGFRQRAFIHPVYQPVVSVVQPFQALTTVQSVVAQPVVQAVETDCLTGCGAQAIVGGCGGYGAQAIIRQRAFVGHGFGARAILGGGIYGRFGAPLLRPRLFR